MKKSIAFLIFCIILMLLIISPKISYAKTDFSSDAKLLEKNGILKGNPKDGLMLESNLLRQELVVIIARLYNEEDRAAKMSGSLEFEDVDKNSYYAPFIFWAVDKGIIQGKSEKQFGFDDKVTLEQIEKVILRILGYEEESKDKDLTNTLVISLGLNDGIDLSEKKYITRGELSRILINTLNTEKKGSTLKLKDILILDM